MGLPEALAAMHHYRINPVGFAYDMLGCQLQHWQAVALRALADKDTERLAIKAGVGPGKTCLLAIAILWWLSTIYPSKVPCTAPSQPHLRDKLWNETRKWMDKKRWMHKFFDWQAERIVLIESPIHHAVARVGRIAVTSSGEQSISQQGSHEDNLLAVIDESSGVPDIVSGVIEGVMSTKQEGNDIKILAAGNPDLPFGWFYRAFNPKPGTENLWRTMTIGYKQADNLSDRWGEQMIAQYGVNDPYVMVKVLAQFPEIIEGGLIGRAAWESCTGTARRKKLLLENPLAEKSLGIDVAGEGSNYNVATRAIGTVLKSNSKAGGLTADARFEWAKNEIIEWNPKHVVVDADGGYGADLCSRLAMWIIEYNRKNNTNIILIRWHGNAEPNNPREFLNARSELAWKIKRAVEAGMLGAFVDGDLSAQITGIKYEHVIKKGTGAVIKLEDKKQFAKRIKSMGGSKSPDELDSGMYALVPALYRTGQIPKAKPKKANAPVVRERHDRIMDRVIV